MAVTPSGMFTVSSARVQEYGTGLVPLLRGASAKHTAFPSSTPRNATCAHPRLIPPPRAHPTNLYVSPGYTATGCFGASNRLVSGMPLLNPTANEPLFPGLTTCSGALRGVDVHP